MSGNTVVTNRSDSVNIDKCDSMERDECDSVDIDGSGAERDGTIDSEAPEDITKAKAILPQAIQWLKQLQQ